MASASSEKHFSAISREVNDCGFYPHEVGFLLATDHRYLQNEFGKCALFFLFRLGENYENGYYDPRNEYTAKVAYEMVKVAREGLTKYTDSYGYDHYTWSNELSGFYYSYMSRRDEFDKIN